MARRTTKFLVMTLTVGLSGFVGAQQVQKSHNADSTRNAEITIRGCVTGEKRYTFMQESTGEIFDLSGSNERFADLRGKLIEVTANEFAPPKNQSNGLPKLSVKRMRVVADKCPIQAHPEPVKPN